MTVAPPPEAPLRRVVLAGLGGRGDDWLAALASPEAERAGLALVGLFDPDPDRALAALARVGRAVPVGGDLRALLDLGADLVVDPGGPGTRLALARAALAAGAGLLCEPPLAADDETARALLGLAGRAPGRLSVAHATRPLDGARALRALGASGTLGRPLTLRAELRADRRGDEGPALHAALRGAALDAFDAARLILDAEPLEVRCVERGAEARDGEGVRSGGSEVHAVFDMAGGAVFALTANLREAGPPAAPAGRWRLVLAEGAAHWDGQGPVRAWASGEARPVPLPEGGDAPAAPLLRLLLEAAAPGPARPGGAAASSRDAAASLAMGLAAIRSARAGGRPEAVRPLGLTAPPAGLGAPRPPVPTAREAL